jgi:hypothetical protein
VKSHIVFSETDNTFANMRVKGLIRLAKSNIIRMFMKTGSIVMEHSICNINRMMFHYIQTEIFDSKSPHAQSKLCKRQYCAGLDIYSLNFK